MEQESETLQDENDGLQESVRMLLTQRDERLAAAERAAERMDGYVKLPVDKDGVSIREDDWMLSLSGKPEQVRGVSREGYYVLRGASWLWMRANRHHHAPNPASVLREFADKLCDLCATEYDCDETRAELLGQYAAKLDALCGRE